MSSTFPIKSRTQSLLNSCKHLKEFKQLHAHMIKQVSFSPHIISFHLSKLASLCAVLPHHGNLSYAKSIFHHLHSPPISLWNSLIRGLSLSKQHSLEALALYRSLLISGPKPNNFTFPFLIKACTRASTVHFGAAIHAHVLESGLEGDCHIRSCLIHFYANGRDLNNAMKVFDLCYDDDVVSWNSMIDGCVKCGDMILARSVFDKMACKDVISWNSMINGYGASEEVGVAEKLFDEMPERNAVSWNSMLSAYAKCGKVDDALGFFRRMPRPDVVSWNTMLACYEQSGRSKETLALFHEMQGGFVTPDEMTFATVLSACADLGALEQGKRLHEYMVEWEVDLNPIVKTALLDMYSRSGCIAEAVELFNSIENKDVLAWNTILSAMARHGWAKEALQLFERMQGEGMKPNDMTFGVLLAAFSHAGMVEEAKSLLDCMGHSYGVDPKIEHYGCVIDLLARHGHLGKAIELVESMPMKPNAAIWGSLSGGCRIHADNVVGERVGKCLVNLEPRHSGRYVLLSNIYSTAKRWDDASQVRKHMKAKRVKKVIGTSN